MLQVNENSVNNGEVHNEKLAVRVARVVALRSRVWDHGLRFTVISTNTL